MKIVINSCYGGFSLSKQATKRLAELQGKKCFFYTSSKDIYEKVDDETESSFWSAFTIENPDELNEILNHNKSWRSMTDEQRDEYNNKFREIHINNRPSDRTDPLLIQVVEELGEKADGDCAELKIIEIPDFIEYYIREYDGNESVEEKHRSWD